jgi:LysM repeat protein
MKAKQWLLFIVLNVIVSVLATLWVLSLSGRFDRIVVVTATPDATSLALASAATSAPQNVAPVERPASSTAITYTIEPGDTLGGIALGQRVLLEDLLLANNLSEESIIVPGQVLVIPLGEVMTPTPVTPSAVPPTTTPVTVTPYATETPTPPGPVQVRIREVLAPGILTREGVVIVNRGRTVSLRGWKLSAADADDAYVFPRITLAQEVPITVYTIAGDDTPYELHWGRGAAQWGVSNTIIELRDADDDLIATFTAP